MAWHAAFLACKHATLTNRNYPSPALRAEARDLHRSLTALLAAGPERHATCCSYECEACAGYGTDCESCEATILTLADEALAGDIPC